MKSNKKLFGRVLAMALAVVMTLSMPGVGQVFASAGDNSDSGDDTNPVVITQEFEPESDDSVLDDVLDVDEAGPQEGTSDGPGSVSDGVDAVPGDNIQDETKSDSEASEGGSDDILDPGQDDDVDVIPGGQEPGVNPDDIQNSGGTDVVPGDDDGNSDLNPGIDPDRAVIEAALESFQNAYQIFINEFAHEKSMHRDGLEHICAYRDFDAFLDRLDLVYASVSGVDLSGEAGYIAMIDDLDEKLSEAAVSAYLARGEAILSGEYADLARFDADVSYMNELRQYMTHDALRSTAVVSMAEQVGFARAELVEDLDNSNAPETPEIPEVPASVQAVRDAYAALCDGIDSLSFDQILARLDRIADLIDQVDPEDMTDDVQIISGYLPEIKSQRALSEFCTQVLIIREKAAAGRYDNTAEDFDRAAAQAEFDAIRFLSRYMLPAELNSENYANGLKALSNLEILMDTPVDQGLSERAEAFLIHVEQIQEAAGTEYVNRPYALDKVLEALLTECNSLDPSDLLDEDIQTAKTILENMRRRIVIKPEIYAFLDAAYALLDVLNAGESLESDHVMNLAMAVVDAMDLLTESDLENPEVLAVYRQLSEAGLVPDGDVVQDEWHMNITYRYLNAYVLDDAQLSSGDWFFAKQFTVNIDNSGYFPHFELFPFLFFDYDAGSSLYPYTLAFAGVDSSSVKVFVSTVSTDMLLQELDRMAPYNMCDLSHDTLMAFVNRYYTELAARDNMVVLPDGVTSCLVHWSDDWQNVNLEHGSSAITFGISANTPDTGLVIGDRIHFSERVIGSPVSYAGEWYDKPVVGVPDGLNDVVVGRQVSGVLTNGDKPIENAELALFSYESGAYVRLERDIHGNRIEAIRTDSNGAYVIPELPEGDYYLAVRNVDGLAPVENSGLMSITDDMHGLAGWQFVTETPAHLYSCSEFKPIVAADPSKYLQNVVLDFEFETSVYTGSFTAQISVVNDANVAVDDAGIGSRTAVISYTSKVWQDQDIRIDARFKSFSLLFFENDPASTIYPKAVAAYPETDGAMTAFVSTAPVDTLLQAFDAIVPNRNPELSVDEMLAFVNAYYNAAEIDGEDIILPAGVTSCIVVYDDDLVFSQSKPDNDYLELYVIANKPDDGFAIGDLMRTKFRGVVFVSRAYDKDSFDFCAALLPESVFNWLYDVFEVVVGRQVSGRLALSVYDTPVDNVELALFSYDSVTNAYVRLERDVTGNRIGVIRTDEDGNYLIPKLPAGDYYLAVRNLGSLAPSDSSVFTAVSDDMHGLSGWQFVSSVPVHAYSCNEFDNFVVSDPLGYLEAMKTDSSKYLQNIVQDIELCPDYNAGSPVELSFHIWEQANYSGFAAGKSGLLPIDEDDPLYGVYENLLGIMQRDPLSRGVPIASLAAGDIGYMTADIRVTAESGARDIDVTFGSWDGVGACYVDSFEGDIVGVYELDASGRPVRMLSDSEYTIGLVNGEACYLTFSDDLMFYGAAYRVLARFRVTNSFLYSGFGATYSAAVCDYGFGFDSVLSGQRIEDVAWWCNGGVEIYKTDMSGTVLRGAEFQLFQDEDCTEPVLFVMDRDGTCYVHVSDFSDDAVTAIYGVDGSVGILSFDQVYTTLTPDTDTAWLWLRGLRSGAYYLKEVTYPNGYEAADGGAGVTKIYINNHDGQVVEDTEAIVTIQNREIDPTWIEYSMSKTVSAGWNDSSSGPDIELSPSDLTVTLTPTMKYPIIGQSYSYMAEITNDSGRDVVVNASLCLNEWLNFDSCSDNGRYEVPTRTICWDDIFIPVNGSKSFNIFVSVREDAIAGTDIRNEIRVVCDDGRSFSGNTTVTVSSLSVLSTGFSARAQVFGANNVWLASQNGDLTKLTIDKIGKPVDEFNYTYTLRFDMVDPGVGQYKAVDDLVLYDELESGTDSRYAGRLDHISISGLGYGWLAVLQSLIPDSIGDNETLAYSSGLDSTHCLIYVSAAGVVPDADLPDALVSITGRSDWIETDEALSNVDKDKITAVAVYLPGLMVAHDVTTINLDSPAYLQVDLHMVHAGHADYTGVDKILTNGFTAGYIAEGADEFTIDTRPDLTEVEILYKNTGVVLPVTGGPGVTGVLVTGLVFLVPAAFVLTVKKRED